MIEKFDDVFNAFQEQFSFLAEQLIIGDDSQELYLPLS